jgi:hypothetical protein
MSQSKIKTFMSALIVPPTIEREEHWTLWLARKCYKSSFRDRFECKSSPANNTGLLYDGSALARQIVSEAQKVVISEPASKEGLIALGILKNALDYMKGQFVGQRFSFTREFFSDLESWVANTKAEPEELIQISPADITNDEGYCGVPKVGSNVPSTSGC